MKKLLLLSFILFSQTAFASVACPDPQDFKPLQFKVVNRIGFNNQTYWQLLSNQFADQGNQWNLLFSIKTANNIENPQVIAESIQFFAQQRVLITSQTAKDSHTICRYSVENSRNKIIAVSPPIKFITQVKGRFLSSPYFPDIFIENSWVDSPKANQPSNLPKTP